MSAERSQAYSNTVNRELNVKNRQTTVNFCGMGTCDRNSTRKMMERETGIEPATSSLGSWRSTAELLPLTGKAQRQTLVSFLMCLQKVIQIIIPEELICKKCSLATLRPQLDCPSKPYRRRDLLASLTATFG